MTLPPVTGQELEWLLAIRAAPDDLALHRIFADWLEEQGQVERAGVIREAVLAAEEGDFSWDDPFNREAGARPYRDRLFALVEPLKVADLTLHLGLPKRMQMEVDTFLRHGAELAAWAPTWRSAELLSVHSSQFTELAACPTLAQLEQLAIDLHDTENGDRLLTYLEKSSFIRPLRELSLMKVRLSAAGLAEFGLHKNWDSLENLTIGECVRGSFASGLRGVAQLPRLTTFRLNATTCDDVDLAAGLDAPGWQHLQTLVLPFDGVGTASLASLGMTAARPNLQNLYLWGDRQTLSGWIGLVRQKVWPKLRSLSLAGTGFDSDAARLVFPWLSGCALEELDLTANLQLDANSLVWLAQCSQAPSLKRLNLTGCNCNAEAVRHLAHAPSLAQLRECELGDNPLGPNGPLEIVAAPFWHTLVHLELGGTSLGDEGVANLVAAPLPQRLSQLGMSNCDLTDRSAERLARWLSKLQLKELELSDNQITDAGADALLSVKRRQPRLQIHLENNLISPTALARWEKYESR